MLLIHEPTGQRRERGEAEGHAVYERMVRFAEELKQRGLLLGVESLASQDRAAKVRVSGGKANVLDGPFAEAKEMIGGFFLLSCETRKEAIEIALQCPAAQWATVEVREIGPCYT